MGPQDAAANAINISVDAVIQQNSWGEGLGRCEVQVAFTRPKEGDGMGEGPGQLWDPLNFPTQDQECVSTLRDPDEMQALLDSQPVPEDNWEIFTRLSVGSVVLLEGESQTLELWPVYDGDTLINYKMEDCGPDTFPFSEAFDLVVPEDSEVADAFRVENALATGPKMTVLGVGEDEGGNEWVYQDEDFDLLWEFGGDVPVLDMDLSHTTYVTVRNDRVGGVQEFEALVCMVDPSDGSLATDFTITSTSLRELTPHQDGAHALRIQLDSRTEGPELEFPWGERIRLQSTVSVDGPGVLYESRE